MNTDARLESLAKSSIEIQYAQTESDAIAAVMGALQDSGFSNAILSLYDDESGKIIGHVVSGTQWREVIDMTNRHLAGNDILAVALRSREALFVPDSRLDPRCEQDVVREANIKAQFVVPLVVGEEMIGTLQVDMGERDRLAPDEALLLQAFAGHMAIAISRLRGQEKAFKLVNQVMSSSRFLAAETLSSSALHSVGHMCRRVLDELSNELKRPEVKGNRHVLELLSSWSSRFTEIAREIQGPLRFVHSTNLVESTDVHQEIVETVEVWNKFLRQNNCKVQLELSATSAICRIGAAAFREILSILLVNAVEAHAKQVVVRSVNRRDIESPQGNYLTSAFCMEFGDNGVGIIAGAGLFRSGYSTKADSAGHGLGLFIARHLARRAGGDVWLDESLTVSKLTIFQLVLPTVSNNT